ncbi:MAG: hypothetical protein ABEJ42_08815 [Halobacteriaceae archaeon]
MGIDQRTRTALLAAGVDGDVLRDAEREAAADAAAAADRIEGFLGGPEDSGDDPVGPSAWTPTTVYSEMDVAHSAATYSEHTVRYADLFTHAQDVRGYLRFETWGVPVTGGRVLSEDVVELTLGPTVDDRVRFAREREHLE